MNEKPSDYASLKSALTDGRHRKGRHDRSTTGNIGLSLVPIRPHHERGHSVRGYDL